MGVRLRIVEASLLPSLESWGFRRYEDYIECERGEVVSRTGTSETRRLEPGPGAGAYFLKRYFYRGERWQHRFRPTKGWVEARNYALLRERCGVRVPDVIALGARRGGLRLLDGFILTRGIAGAMSLEAWCRGLDVRRDAGRDGRDASPHTRRQVFDELARIVAAMHRAGFYHVDLQWRNLAVRASAGAAELFVLDSSRGGLRYSPWMRRHGQMRDLSSLEKSAREFVPRTMRIRWLAAYLRGMGRSVDWRRLARRIAADRAAKDGGRRHDDPL